MALFIPATAEKDLRKIPERERKQLLARLMAIARAPNERHKSVAALQGKPAGRFRVRQGDWRATFSIVDGDVAVHEVGHRSKVYDR